MPTKRGRAAESAGTRAPTPSAVLADCPHAQLPDHRACGQPGLPGGGESSPPAVASGEVHDLAAALAGEGLQLEGEAAL